MFKENHRQGGRLVDQGCQNQENVKEITGEAERSEQADTKKDPKRSHIIFYIAFFSLLVFPALTPAQPETQPHSPQRQSSLPAEAPAGVMRLTLDQAVTLALKQNTPTPIPGLTPPQRPQKPNIS